MFISDYIWRNRKRFCLCLHLYPKLFTILDDCWENSPCQLEGYLYLMVYIVIITDHQYFLRLNNYYAYSVGSVIMFRVVRATFFRMTTFPPLTFLEFLFFLDGPLWQKHYILPSHFRRVYQATEQRQWFSFFCGLLDLKVFPWACCQSFNRSFLFISFL